MTKALLIAISYDGHYRSLSEVTLYPEEARGIIFDGLEDGYYENVVPLGELEGKHSDCYGDAEIKTINLNVTNNISPVTINTMVEDSEFGYIEDFLESMLQDFDDYDEENCELCGDFDWLIGEVESEEQAEILYEKYLDGVFD